ncbi:MAG: ATP phosphoribosyltransferase regulatory subunit, partial [Minisyncoccia bacterium]
MSKNKKINTQPLSGFMELRPQEQILFNTIRDSIEKNYRLFGFIPMDNPVIERREVLFAKAGGETETQIYELQKGDNELALRFDLTVPLARYVADKYGDLTFPFKRYQIAKVYRGEKPQAGRFREFYQADIDIIGNETLDISYDAELPATIISVFRDLGFENFTIRINNRKIFDGLFASCGLQEKSKDIMNVIDRLEKIGKESVQTELQKLDISAENIETLFNFLDISGNVAQVIAGLQAMNIENEIFAEGLSELKTVSQNL